MKADASRVLVRKHLRPYFTVFLPKQRGCSDNTIQSIHDTWNLFLRYLSAAKGIDNSRLAFSDIDPAVVTGFLDQMEFEKGWKPSTRSSELEPEDYRNRIFEQGAVVRMGITVCRPEK